MILTIEITTQQQLFIEFVLLDASSSDAEDSPNKKGKTRQWIKEKKDSGYFNNPFQKLKVESTEAFKEIFRISYRDLKQILSRTEALVTPHQIVGGYKVI